VTLRDDRYAASVVPRSPRGAAYLIVARMVQGVGEASTIVCSAIARDVLTDVGARVKVTSALGALRPLATVVAPSVGGLVGAGFGWRVLFKALAVWGAALWVLSLVALPETRPAETTSSSLFAGLALVGRRILKRRADLSQDVRLAVASMLVVAFGFAGVMAFLSTISILLETRFGRSVVTTSLLMGSIPVGIILTNAGVAALFRTTQPTAADHHHRRRGATTEHGSTGGGSSAAIALSVRLVRGSAGGMLTAGLLARGTASLDDVNIGIGKCDPGHHTRTCMITRRLGFAGVAPRRPFRTTYPPMLATIYLFALTQAAGVGAAMALALQPFGDVAASAAAVTNLLRTGVSVAVSQLATDLVQYFGVRGLFWVLAFAGASAYLAAHLYLGRGVHTPRPPPKESLLDEPSSAEISSTRRGTTP